MDRKIGALLELFGLSDAAEQGIASYSKGMKQKILVIAALLHDPDLLIFDEPDSGLDVTAALVLRHLVANLAARGKAILYTSHILDVVEKLCTRVIVLHEGRVVADDSVTAASHAPGEQFARTGLRAPRAAPGSRADRAGHRRRGDRRCLIGHLTRLFLRRFVENDLISPDADRAAGPRAGVCDPSSRAVCSSAFCCRCHIWRSPYPLPGRTAANMVRVQFLYAAWSMTVMALVAVSVWDALALDSRDTEILGPLPLPRGVIVRAKVSALIMFAAGFAAALNVVPGTDPSGVGRLSRLRPSVLQVGTLVAAHLTSTTAAAAFGFAAVLGLRELLHAILGTTLVSTDFRGRPSGRSSWRS